MPRKAGRSVKQYHASKDNLDAFVLGAVRVLAPGTPAECSTLEIRNYLALSGLDLSSRSIAARLIRLRAKGLVTAREIVQRHVWRPTAAGRKAL